MSDWTSSSSPPPEPDPEMPSEEEAAGEELHAAPPPPEPPVAPAPETPPLPPTPAAMPTPPVMPTPPTPPIEPAPPTPPAEPVDAGFDIASSQQEVREAPDIPDAPSPPEPIAPSAETPTTSVDPTEWFDPPAVEAAPVIDEPVVARTEEEIIEVPESEDIEEVIEEADDDEDEIVFDLAGLSTEERRHLSMRLTGAGISHIWEVATDLVVSVQDAPTIESYIEEVRNPEGFGDEELAALEEESDVDDEEVYAAMSNLYVAADRLMHAPDDEATAGTFYLAADDVEGLPAPFGFDPRVWTQVLGLADSITSALDAEGDPETIGNDAKTLRQLLVNYV